MSAAVDTDDTQTGRETKAAGIQNPLAGKSEAEGRKRGGPGAGAARVMMNVNLKK